MTTPAEAPSRQSGRQPADGLAAGGVPPASPAPDGSGPGPHGPERLQPGASTQPPVIVTRLSVQQVVVAVVVLVAVMLLGIMVGAADLGVRAVASELLNAVPGVSIDSGLDDAARSILWALRLPRVVLGGLVGASLATAGAAYQGVFRNPLADPYLLGAASGAGLAAVIAIAYVPTLLPGGLTLPVLAFVGSLFGVGATWVVASSTSSGSSPTSLILAGVAVTYFLTAGTTWVQQRNVETIQEVYGFILGQLGTSGWSEVITLAVPGALALTIVLLHRRTLDVMAVGEREASSLGVDAARTRVVVIAAASLATAAAVAVSGLIGFVGVLVPHAVRLAVGGSYRLVLPLSVFYGAAFLVIADILARTLVAPAELPIGVITALVGAPFFAFVLRRARSGFAT